MSEIREHHDHAQAAANVMRLLRLIKKSEILAGKSPLGALFMHDGDDLEIAIVNLSLRDAIKGAISLIRAARSGQKSLMTNQSCVGELKALDLLEGCDRVLSGLVEVEPDTSDRMGRA